jgi:hypothetical protein
MVIMPPDRTAITQENPQAFPIVHSFESGQLIFARNRQRRACSA